MRNVSVRCSPPKGIWVVRPRSSSTPQSCSRTTFSCCSPPKGIWVVRLTRELWFAGRCVALQSPEGDLGRAT